MGIKITFRINYHTRWGENLFITGSHKALGEWSAEDAFPMYHNGDGEWEANLVLGRKTDIEYKYLLRTENHSFIWEGGKNRVLITGDYTLLETRDFWRPQADSDSAFQTQVFTKVLMPPPGPDFKITLKNYKRSIQLRLRETRIPKGKTLAVTGNLKSLGEWKTPLLLDPSDYPVWKVNISLHQAKFPIYYKYVLVDIESGKIEIWEDGDERILFYVDKAEESILHVQNDEKFRFGSSNWKGAGVAVPVFSLRTNEGFGIGEFNDIKKLVDWSASTGLKMIQLLPINETVATHSWLDSYPYKAISVFALHPAYLNLDNLGQLNDVVKQKEFNALKEELNAKPYVDYVKVTQVKSRYYKLIFDQEWKNVKKSGEFEAFFKKNREWLEPYAAFCYLRDQHKTSNFREWEKWAQFDSKKIKKLVEPGTKHYADIAVHYFIQFYLDKQLKEVVTYAHERGVALKGDIPIGISPNSIEAWTKPELFNLNGQAGAPPDDFAVLGQNWGFPTYNWDEMEKDGFDWWKKRLQAMSKYFDAFRIDHILGFFRIWEIPQNALHGLLGYFKPGLPFTPNELEDWGVSFDYERMVKPYIRGHFLREIFGEFSEEVRKNYLNELDYNVFELKPEFDTQKKIFAHFTPLEDEEGKLTEKEVTVRDGLISLLDEVLFIRDPYSPEAYHPRIALHYTFSYRELDSETKDKLDDLYIDFFYKRHEQFWKNEAMKKLPALTEASEMLICGEDLGMVPDTVPEVMNELNILSLEIQRMPKNPDIEFGHPADAPYLSVCTTSTHDMSTIRGWWEENRENTQRFFHHILGHNGDAPFFAEPWICREIINQHLYSPAMWTIFPIQDLIAMDGELRWDETDKERINVPSDEKNKWRYRMILSIEELLGAEDFNRMLTAMIHGSGRNTDV
ncbi:MAG TPA: 4-alpha-glucanotransferase [Draconibacterium sp.]|nr:4-alpha-glucanotransferase [Draconibacterium sp.]